MKSDAHTHPEAFPGEKSGDGLYVACMNASRESDWAETLTLAKAWQGEAKIIPHVGLHPWFVDAAAEGWQARLEATLLAARWQFPAVGLGEIGLDRPHAKTDAAWQRQQEAFLQQLSLARRLTLPASLHCVRCWDDLLRCLTEIRPGNAPMRVILHGFSAPAAMVQRFMALSDVQCYFSFSPEILNPKRTKLRATLCAVPKDRLLAETDMAVGTREEVLAAVLAGISASRGDLPVEAVGELTTRNLCSIFSLPVYSG